MSDQPTLFPVAASLRTLTPRQARIIGILATAPDGLEATELGARIHAGQLRHPPDTICEHCGRDGHRALKERAIRQRTQRLPGGVYTIRGATTSPAPPSAQLEELPGSTWEDAFGGGFNSA
jgi:hypothetical protein